MNRRNSSAILRIQILASNAEIVQKDLSDRALKEFYSEESPLNPPYHRPAPYALVLFGIRDADNQYVTDFRCVQGLDRGPARTQVLGHPFGYNRIG